MRAFSSPGPMRRHITVAADTTQLAPLRDEAAAFVRATGASDTVVDQFELAVSELATNVIQHSDSPEVTVVLRADVNGLTLDVSDAPEAVDLDTPHLPDPEQLSGRGLFIVHALMDSVELVDIDGNQHLRCSKLAS